MSSSAAMVRRLRRVAFLGVAAWMLLSPSYIQVFGGRPGSVRSWRMFHNRGVGICSAIYYEDGKRVDRYAMFGARRANAPDAFRRITDERAAREMGRRICDRVGRPADVRVELRCGIQPGLRTILDREDNLCGS